MTTAPGRAQLTGIAAVVSDAVATAVDKLDMEIRDGAATHTEDGTSAAADGIRIHLGNDALTEEAPPQVAPLCTVTDVVSDPLSDGGLILPPICAVPDVTGTTDTYDFVMGKASVYLIAQMFPSFGIDGDLGGDTGLGGAFADADPGGSAGTFQTSPGGSADFSTPSVRLVERESLRRRHRVGRPSGARRPRPGVPGVREPLAGRRARVLSNDAVLLRARRPRLRTHCRQPVRAARGTSTVRQRTN